MHHHVPVLLPEVIEALRPESGKVYVDATFGRGGYTRAMLEAQAGQVIAIDQDPQAIAFGEELVQQYPGRLILKKGRFSEMPQLLAENSIQKVDGIVFDLGISSPQLAQADRGFSFMQDGPLDMRMSCEGATAADLVNTLAEEELADLIWRYGEERYSRKIARAIVADRQVTPFTRTHQLSKLVESVLRSKKEKIHPATRTFQALRIAVNKELEELQDGLFAAELLLKPYGKLAVVTFHSLEDREVKQFIEGRTAGSIAQNRHLPQTNPSLNARPTFRWLKKRVLPSPQEIQANPRARSSKLRVAERLEVLS